MRSGYFRIIVVTALVTCAATVVLLRWGLIPGYSGSHEVARPIERVAAAPAAVSLSADEEINVRVYNKVSPGVVNITSTVVEYGFFFAPVQREGTGSGLVIDMEGHILTNYHVIAGARELEVALPDQSKYRAQRVGEDSPNDLAVIRLVNCPKDRLHPVAFGDSSQLRVGQKVLAIGNPFRLQNTLTTGIISSLNRTIQTENGEYLINNIIQTDAAINPGNSGGPLLNSAGEMIGVNTSIFTVRGGNIGIGFAVPVNTVRRVVDDLLKHGRVLRPDLGVAGYTISEELASALDLPVTSGVLVARVTRGGAAENAGIRPADRIVLVYNERFLVGGDIITHVDGKAVSSVEELRLALEGKRPRDSITVTIYRGRTRMERRIDLTEPQRRGFRF